MTANVDPAEIAKFEALASRWWDPESDFKPLHKLNPLRVNFINRHINVAELDVLDVGCGGGILSEALAKLGGHVMGIDMTTAPLEVAKLHALEQALENVSYEQSTAEAFAAEKPASFDVITCMEMLEHVPDPSSVVGAIATLLKPGGVAFFSTINRNPKAFLTAIVGAEYIARMLPKGTHEYRKFIRPSELVRSVRDADLSPVEFKGMHYNPLTQQFSVTDDVSVNYMLCVKKGGGTE